MVEEKKKRVVKIIDAKGEKTIELSESKKARKDVKG
jgi:hypothetical protein